MINTELIPFISKDDSGDVLGIYSYGCHEVTDLREKAIQKYGECHWVIVDLLQSGFFDIRYFTLNGDNYLIPAISSTSGSFQVSMWCRNI